MNQVQEFDFASMIIQIASMIIYEVPDLSDVLGEENPDRPVVLHYQNLQAVFPPYEIQDDLDSLAYLYHDLLLDHDHLVLYRCSVAYHLVVLADSGVVGWGAACLRGEEG